MRKAKGLLLFFIVLCSCTSQKNDALTIAIASSLRPALQELTKQFTQKTGVKINLVSGSSGKLTTQIIAGAPYDLFFSADTLYTNYIQSKLSLRNKPAIFAHGKLVLLVNNNLDKKGTGISTLLKNSSIQKIVIPNPKLAPYGKAANDVLNNLGVYKKIEPKLVFAESVSQSNQFIKSTSVDAGFTSASATQIENFIQGYAVYTIPKHLYKPIINSILIVSEAEEKNQDLEEFISFLKTEQAQLTLKAYGYIIPK